jgi:hypothetical protein
VLKQTESQGMPWEHHVAGSDFDRGYTFLPDNPVDGGVED